MRLGAIDSNGNNIEEGHTFRGQNLVSKHVKNGYWAPDNITIEDVRGLERYQNKQTFGWQLYIDNPLEDLEPPQYIKNSMNLSLSERQTSKGEQYQVITATWEITEKSGIEHVCGNLNDEFLETYSRSSVFNYGEYNPKTEKVSIDFRIPDYMPSGKYTINRICMRDIAQNGINIFFTKKPDENLNDNYFHLDEKPKSIVVKTTNPDLKPPVLDLNKITISAKPTIPEAPNGETTVDISFYISDNISGYELGAMYLRDPFGTMHNFYHYPNQRGEMYPSVDTRRWTEFTQNILLPVGSAPGIWGLAEMTLWDRAGNFKIYDFTEIVRFEVGDAPVSPEMIVSLPHSTSLLPNYPNPFNPETWIPYQLSEPAEVQMAIYDTGGSLIRKMDIGYKPSGIYTDRSNAVYWDGRNVNGENVASGIYFYTLIAGDFKATKKMLIIK